MAEYSSGVYFISRKRGKGAKSGGRRGAGLMIVVLLLLTAAICLLVVLLPASSDTASAQPSEARATFYFLATQETNDRIAAYDGALSSSARGGAGYIHNDGSYKIIAAAYRSEADALALAQVNDGAFCVKYELICSASDGPDRDAFSFVTGEWFDAITEASVGLERGSLTDAQADLAAKTACTELLRRSDGVKDASLRRALIKAGDYSVPTSATLKSYIRYVAVRALVEVGSACL